VGIALFVFYTSSRPLTGVAPFQDLTLLIGAVSALIAFCWYERRHTEPFVNAALFRNRDFSFAAVCVSIHIMLMGGVGFVIPLMVTDRCAFSAPQAGALLILHAGAPLITMSYLGTERFGIELATYRAAFTFYLAAGVVGAASAFGLSPRLPQVRAEHAREPAAPRARVTTS